jgi:aminoglycoside 3-N-acetyltransferase
MPCCGEDSLVRDLRDLGVDSGDMVLVHSSCSKVKQPPVDIFNALKEVVGENGTLVFPTFSFKKKWGASEMGILTLIASSQADSQRIPHPTHSFIVVGKLADDLGKIRNKSSYGCDSLFARLTELDGKILVVGLSYNNSMTYFHYVEQAVGVSYREIQDLGDGYTIYGRKQRIVTSVDKMGELLEKGGVVSVGKLGDAQCKLMRARDTFSFVSQRVTNEPGLLYEVKNA